MAEEVSGVTRIAVDRTQRDFPRRDSPRQQGDGRRQPRHQTLQAAPSAPLPSDDPPVVGSRLNVRA
jgi:hypothetical protein